MHTVGKTLNVTTEYTIDTNVRTHACTDTFDDNKSDGVIREVNSLSATVQCVYAPDIFELIFLAGCMISQHAIHYN